MKIDIYNAAIKNFIACGHAYFACVVMERMGVVGSAISRG